MKSKIFFFISILIIASSLIVFYAFKYSSEEKNHIHTIAFDPTEKDSFYLGTHHNIMNYKGQTKVKDIGNDDFMGLIIAKDGSFYSSGHSLNIENVGIRKSIDKGKTWEVLAYSGMDFHDMTTSNRNKDIIYALSTPPEEIFVLSRDGGNSWNEIKSDLKQIIFTLEADHQKENVIYAGTIFGIYKSEDYGETWKSLSPLVNISIVAIADDPLEEGIIYASTYTNGVIKTIDNGKTWFDFNKGLPKEIVILLDIDPFDTSKIFAITKNEEIYFHNGLQWEKIES